MITAKQRELRRKHLQASDFPALLGLSPWASEVDVYFSKVHPTEDFVTDNMAAGNWLEKPIIEHVCETLGFAVTLKNLFRVEKHPSKLIGCNVDAHVIDRDEGVEAKFVGPGASEHWGDDATNQVPKHVYVQVQVQMHVCNWSRVWVGAALADYGLQRRIYPIDRDQEVIDAVTDYGRQWWARHVAQQDPPSGEAMDHNLLKSLIRTPKKVAQIDPQLVDAMRFARDQLSLATARHEAAKAAILAAMGDAEAADFGDDEKWITYYEQTTAPAYNQLRMKLDGVFDKYARIGKHRILREAKKGKR